MKQSIRTVALVLLCIFIFNISGSQKMTVTKNNNSLKADTYSAILSPVTVEDEPSKSYESKPQKNGEPTLSKTQNTPSKKNETSQNKAEKLPESANVKTFEIPSVKKSEMRAVWISFLDLSPILKERSESEFTKSVKSLFSKCRNGGINTVIVHARSHGDAFYPSKYFPTSYYFTGKRGSAAKFDPLKIMVDEAHAEGLRIEAWINPYRSARIGSGEDWNLTKDEATAKWLGTSKVFVAPSGKMYQFNPANAEVQRLILNGVSEILDNYAVDGIHFDDYFYPTGCGDCDAAEYEPYQNTVTLGDFRRDCVSKLVKSVFELVHDKAKKSEREIVFGISPAGNYNNCMNKCFADVSLWGSASGYVDYLAPQIYWGYGQGSLPYLKALDIWSDVVTSNSVKLIIGLAAYKVGTNSIYWNDGDILARQITDARLQKLYGGFILFRSDFYFSNVCNTERANLEKLLK